LCPCWFIVGVEWCGLEGAIAKGREDFVNRGRVVFKYNIGGKEVMSVAYSSEFGEEGDCVVVGF
jgi:hypothetical protein